MREGALSAAVRRSATLLTIFGATIPAGLRTWVGRSAALWGKGRGRVRPAGEVPAAASDLGMLISSDYASFVASSN
ncbi:hypothetical protein STRMOE7_35290 [Streptomyces sp. MOE7]|nr:hypothetical protein STRMOE7_35290 [Streptomyces sp. MOE7]